MTNPFFDHPVLNSPYAYPARHWELDDQVSRHNRLLSTAALQHSSRRFPSLVSVKGPTPNNSSCSTKAKGCPRQPSNMNAQQP
jgi:hypothetical protein